MFRKASMVLEEWKNRYNRKPLIIRGARQAGKTWLIRNFAYQNFEYFIEINLDRNPEKLEFITTDVTSTLQQISIDSGTPIIPNKTLIFLDEAQTSPNLLHCLRYFYEDRPDIHIICADSVIDFSTEANQYSLPVGRVSYFHLGPMTFEEFLIANGEEYLCQFLESCALSIPDSLHKKLLHYAKLYCVVGGMPAAVLTWIETQDLSLVHQEHESILQTFYTNDPRYSGTIKPQLQRKILPAPGHMDQKAIQKKTDHNQRQQETGMSFYPSGSGTGAGGNRNMMNRNANPYTAQNNNSFMPTGMNQQNQMGQQNRMGQTPMGQSPMGQNRMGQSPRGQNHGNTGAYGNRNAMPNMTNRASAGQQIQDSPDNFKILFLDIGLLSSSLGFHIYDIQRMDQLIAINQEVFAEQFIGQHLLYRYDGHRIPELYFRPTEGMGASSPSNYLIEHNGRVLPVQLTDNILPPQNGFAAQTPDSLKFSRNLGTQPEQNMQNVEELSFSWDSLPIYLIGQTRRLLEEANFMVA